MSAKEKYAEWTKKIPCKNHTKKTCSKFCVKCDAPVCVDCILCEHKKHKIELLDEIFAKKMASFKEIQAKISEDLKICENELSEIKTAKVHSDSKYAYITDEIIQAESKIKELVSNYAQKLRDQIQTEKRTKLNTMSEKRKQVEDAEKKLLAKQEKLKLALDSKQGEKIFQTFSELGDDVNLNFKKLPLEMIFCQGDITQKSVAQLLGSLQPIMPSYEDFPVKIEVLNTYITDLSYVYRIRSNEEKSAWITNYGKRILRHVKISDQNKVITTNELSADIFDMSVMPNNDILLSMRDTFEIKVFTVSGNMESVFTVSPMLPRGIHVTKNNEVILGLTPAGDNFHRPEDSGTKIIVYGLHDKQRQVLCENLFTLPYRVMSNINGDIIVIDSLSANDGRIVVLDNGGKQKWTYQGHPDINSMGKSFDPRDVATMDEGLVVIADCNSSAIHVLSGEGTLLNCQNVKDQGIIYPYCLDIDMHGKLWVGCDTYQGKNDAKIHIANITT